MVRQLRDYQLKSISDVRAAIAKGERRIVLQLPTGAGKTEVASEIITLARAKDNGVIFAVPALSLIDQTVARFEAIGMAKTDIGVLQGNHERTNWTSPVQVASVQTLQRRDIPKAALVIIDECHRSFEFYTKWFNDPDWQNVPFIGLSATPWAKGMAQLWHHLIVGATTAELIERGVLSTFKVFAPSHPDLRGVKTVAGDYQVDGLSQAMNTPKLVGDILQTWLEKGRGRPTLCFAVDRAHAQHLQERFRAAGITTDYQDAYTEREERGQIEKRFALGYTEVVFNVGTLTTGIDWDVRCIIMARPTKSEILYVQIIGRGLRQAPGKDHCLILDHSDTTLKLGFVTDIHHEELDDGSKKADGDQPAKPAAPKECPQCTALRPSRMLACPNCGYKPSFEASAKVDAVDGELHELSQGKSNQKVTTKEKEQFYGELLLHAQRRGYAPGWAFHAYKEKFHVEPASFFSKRPADSISGETHGWITYRNIKRAKSRQKAS